MREMVDHLEFVGVVRFEAGGWDCDDRIILHADKETPRGGRDLAGAIAEMFGLGDWDTASLRIVVEAAPE